MRQLVILSGKGGTGKTTVTAALAHLASQEMAIVLADADVDAANLELVLDPVRQEAHDFLSGQVAVIDADVCTACGVCADVCRFDAVTPVPAVYLIDAVACEGCAACHYQCPEQAIHMQEEQAGYWYRSSTRFGPLVHAQLLAGRENSGKLVTMVKQQARQVAKDTGAELLLVDGPPGIGCPVISASSGMDAALLVVEPTISGVHDLGRVLATTAHFGVPALVAINKADLNSVRSDEIALFCEDRNISLVGRIPYDTAVTEAMVEGLPVTARADGPVTEALVDVWRQVRAVLDHRLV
jgi:MinD superfamily P-loop ATPase